MATSCESITEWCEIESWTSLSCLIVGNLFFTVVIAEMTIRLSERLGTALPFVHAERPSLSSTTLTRRTRSRKRIWERFQRCAAHCDRSFREGRVSCGKALYAPMIPDLRRQNRVVEYRWRSKFLLPSVWKQLMG